jgi:hypothetical protein
VHVHRCFAWESCLEAAAANFTRARLQLQLPADTPGCLLLAESAGGRAYHALRHATGAVQSRGWHVQATHEARSIVVGRIVPSEHQSRASSALMGQNDAMVVVAGRQIVTAERLEVLALAFDGNFPDGEPMHAVLRALTARGVLAVIPWGVGKWMGRRGRLVRDLIDQWADAPFCLGDNGGRAGAFGRPSLFGVAEGHGIPVLAGSDPLPLPGQVSRVGSYGFLLDAAWETSMPATGIVGAISALRVSPPVYGQLSSIQSMVRAQLDLRWRRRRAANT